MPRSSQADIPLWKWDGWPFSSAAAASEPPGEGQAGTDGGGSNGGGGNKTGASDPPPATTAAAAAAAGSSPPEAAEKARASLTPPLPRRASPPLSPHLLSLAEPLQASPAADEGDDADGWAAAWAFGNKREHTSVAVSGGFAHAPPPPPTHDTPLAGAAPPPAEVPQALADPASPPDAVEGPECPAAAAAAASATTPTTTVPRREADEDAGVFQASPFRSPSIRRGEGSPSQVSSSPLPPSTTGASMGGTGRFFVVKYEEEVAVAAAAAAGPAGNGADVEVEVLTAPGQGVGVYIDDGMRLTGVGPGTAAERAGFGGYVGATVLRVNGVAVSTVDAAEAALRARVGRATSSFALRLPPGAPAPPRAAAAASGDVSVRRATYKFVPVVQAAAEGVEGGGQQQHAASVGAAASPVASLRRSMPAEARGLSVSRELQASVERDASGRRWHIPDDPWGSKCTVYITPQ